jgi:pimeloyl-ACP methyl ester carboxylesterase
MAGIAKRILYRAAVIIAAAWLGLTALAALFHPYLLYYPVRELDGFAPAGPGAESREEFWLAAPDGERLHAWHVPAARGVAKDKTLLVFHGNAGNLSTASARLALYSRLGFDCYMVDYHGFGKSGGEPSEKNLYMDAETIWNHLVRERGIPPGNIVIVGYSLGGAVASWLAERQPRAAGLVLESTFTRLSDIAADFFPFLPCRLILGNAYDTFSRLPNLSMPLLVAHGKGDRLVAFKYGERILQAFPGEKAFLLIGDDHNPGFMNAGKKYEDGISGFVERLAKTDSQGGDAK